LSQGGLGPIYEKPISDRDKPFPSTNLNTQKYSVEVIQIFGAHRKRVLALAR